ncbi:Fic family protein [bacterium]|nr:Fic family protein [bacterium]
MQVKVANTLRQIKRATGWSQERLARELAVTVRTLQAWLAGEAAPRVEKVKQIESLAQRALGREEVSLAQVQATEKSACGRHFNYQELLVNPELTSVFTQHLTYHTNAIEGSTLTLAQVQTVLTDIQAVLPDKSLREQMEARGHAAALQYALGQLAAGCGKICWSTKFICDLHLRLMNGIMGGAGQFRQYRVRIAGSFTPLCNYLVVPREMQLLLEDMNADGRQDVDLSQLAHWHARFEQIHPFGDGNGRTGRLMLFLQALERGWYPPLIKREYRYAYYQALEKAQLEGDILPLRLVIGQAIVETQKLLGD